MTMRARTGRPQKRAIDLKSTQGRYLFVPDFYAGRLYALQPCSWRRLLVTHRLALGMRPLRLEQYNRCSQPTFTE